MVWMRGVILALVCALNVASAAQAETGMASWYGRGLTGHKMANGKPFHPDKLTAASRHLPLGTKVRVKRAATGKSVPVTITDRGPYKKGRVIDLSPKAAKKLDMLHVGVAKVHIKPLSGGREPVDEP